MSQLVTTYVAELLANDGRDSRMWATLEDELDLET